MKITVILNKEFIKTKKMLANIWAFSYNKSTVLEWFIHEDFIEKGREVRVGKKAYIVWL